MKKASQLVKNIVGISVVGRPVATGGGEGGAQPPLEKIEPPLGCPPWHFIGIGIEVYSPPGILSAPPTNDTWLRRWLLGVPPPTPPVGNNKNFEEKGMQQEVQSSI